jgi:hypothetical protein
MERIIARTSGLGLIVGPLAVGAGTVLNIRTHSNLVDELLFWGALLLVLTLPAMYARQARAVGWIGLVGHVLLVAGIVLVLLYGGGFLLYPNFHLAESITAFSLGLSAVAGLLLTSVATARAGVYPRWSGYLFLGASAAFFFDFIIAELLPPLAGHIGGVVLGLLLFAAFASIGLALWRQQWTTSS